MAPETAVWQVTPDGRCIYTTPRHHTIERLNNGLVRLYTYGSGLSSLHTSLVDAYRAARAIDREARS